jgi:molybdopterin-guanine dinucleotide biosynthesis protein A
MDPDKVSGIILAGGYSTRMGFDKGLADFRGKPLIQYSIEILQPICSRIIISTNSPAYHKLGFPVQIDILPGAGPMGGIYSSLLHSETEHNLVLPCDMPFVTPGLLQRILENREGYQVVLPASKPGFPEPLIGYYHKNNITAMPGFIERGNVKLIDYIETTFYRIIPVYSDSNQFININTPEDFRKLAKQKE